MLKGVFTPMVTPFRSDGTLDLDSAGRIVDHLIDGGVNGILFLGSIGEFFALTMEEKRQFIRFAVEAVDGRVAALIGTGGTVVEEVVALNQCAAEAGADAAVVISPYYCTLYQESLYRYYAQVARRSEIPVCLYNFPDRTAVSITPELIVRLVGEFDIIRGIKDTVDNISSTRKIITTVKREFADFAVFSGFDEYLLPNLLSGGNGVIGGLTNVVPRLFAETYEAFEAGDLVGVAEAQKKINILMHLYDVSQPFVGAIKAAASLVVEGVSAECRSPASELSTDQMNAIRNILERAGVPV